jgi:hypothetical protein
LYFAHIRNEPETAQIRWTKHPKFSKNLRGASERTNQLYGMISVPDPSGYKALIFGPSLIQP